VRLKHRKAGLGKKSPGLGRKNRTNPGSSGERDWEKRKREKELIYYKKKGQMRKNLPQLHETDTKPQFCPGNIWQGAPAAERCSKSKMSVESFVMEGMSKYMA